MGIDVVCITSLPIHYINVYVMAQCYQRITNTYNWDIDCFDLLLDLDYEKKSYIA